MAQILHKILSYYLIKIFVGCLLDTCYAQGCFSDPTSFFGDVTGVAFAIVTG